MQFPALKIFCFSMLMLVLILSAQAQNTKGDKPNSSRETRFKKTAKVKKEKPAKRAKKKRTTSSLRAYRPRKKAKGGENAGRPTSPIYRSSNRPQKIYPQSGPFVNNPSKRPRKTEAGRSVTARERRVKVRSASGSIRNTYPQSGRYLNYSSGPGRSRVKKSTNVWARFPRPKQKKEKAYAGDIAGRKIRTKNFESQKPKVITSSGGKARTRTGRTKNVLPSRAARTLSVTPKLKTRNVYRQRGPFVNNPSRKPKTTQRAVSNRRILAKLNTLQGGPDRRPGKKRKVIPRSASGSFIAKKSTNVWAQFPRRKRKGEKAYTKDIAGRKLRMKNYQSPRQEYIPPTFKPRKRVEGDKAYDGGPKYSTSPRTPKAWKGDIANRRLRKNFSSKKGVEGKPVLSPGKRHLGMRYQGERYTGNIKSKRPRKGGGSISGKLWNNQGKSIPARTPGVQGVDKYQGNLKGRKIISDQGEEYTGSIKARKRPKGGGSISGKPWNNQGNPLPPRTPKSLQGIGYSGTIKARKPVKGGGSISGKLWNNEGNPLPPRTPKSLQGIGYSGRIKSRRPIKGGGSISGKLWNNKQAPIANKVPPASAKRIEGFPQKIRMFDQTPGFVDQGEEYTGSIKAKRPKKGGGSISGKLWNNKETPLPPKSIKSDQGVESSGKIKSPKYIRNPNSVTAALRKKKPEKTVETDGLQIKVKRLPYQKNPNSADEALKNIRPENTNKTDGLQQKIKRGNYVKNPNSADDALKKLSPSKNNFALGDFKVKVKRPEYSMKKDAPDGGLPGIKPGKESVKASEYARSMRRSWNYIKNPSSEEGALRVREPGKAFARATDYQGNIKMRKFDLFGKRQMHPDAQFVKTNKNNVDGERDLLTNLKLWWSRLFRKNETQPDHLKDKDRKPRYDKGEQGMWYD